MQHLIKYPDKDGNRLGLEDLLQFCRFVLKKDKGKMILKALRNKLITIRDLLKALEKDVIIGSAAGDDDFQKVV